jgi:hypothetical protein
MAAVKSVWGWAGKIADVRARIEVMLAVAFLIVAGLGAMWVFLLRRYGTAGSIVLLIVAVLVLVSVGLAVDAYRRTHPRPTPPIAGLNTREVLQGKQALGAIQPHSVAASKATESARPHAEAIIRQLQSSPRTQLEGFLQRAEQLRGMGRISKAEKRRAQFQPLGKVSQAAQVLRVPMMIQELHGDIAAWITIKHPEYDERVDQGYTEALEAVREIRDRFYPEKG